MTFSLGDQHCLNKSKYNRLIEPATFAWLIQYVLCHATEIRGGQIGSGALICRIYALAPTPNDLIISAKIPVRIFAQSNLKCWDT
jgi:hypothetical protein